MAPHRLRVLIILLKSAVSFFYLFNQSIEQFQIRQGILSSFEPDQVPRCLKKAILIIIIIIDN